MVTGVQTCALPVMRLHAIPEFGDAAVGPVGFIDGRIALETGESETEINEEHDDDNRRSDILFEWGIHGDSI
jgi:hypothetical protein